VWNPGDGWRSVGGRRVQLGRRVVVDSSVLGSDTVEAVAVSMKWRRGGRWSMGSKGSDCAKGVVSGQWVAAWEGVAFGPGGRWKYMVGGKVSYNTGW